MRGGYIYIYNCFKTNSLIDRHMRLSTIVVLIILANISFYY